MTQRELSVAPKAWPEEERQGGEGEGGGEGGGKGNEEEEALPGSTVEQETTG